MKERVWAAIQWPGKTQRKAGEDEAMGIMQKHSKKKDSVCVKR